MKKKFSQAINGSSAEYFNNKPDSASYEIYNEKLKALDLSSTHTQKSSRFLIVPAFFKLSLIFIYHIMVYLVLRPFEKKVNVNQLRGNVLKNAMIHMGPFYIKMGQIMGTRADLFPQGIIDALKVLHDDVPPMKEKYVEKILTSSYNKPLDAIKKSIFKEFNLKPIASASIAQVHQATLVSGENVAVKIVKYRVREQLDTNLRIIDFMLRILTPIIPLFREQNAPARFQEIKILLVNQANMVIEKNNQQRIADNFKNHEFARVPKLYETFCTMDILVMEFVDAIPFKELHKVEISKKILARRVQDLIYTMLFYHGFAHGDPHPGNIFFSKEGDVIAVDFGIVVDLTEDEKWGSASFAYACIRQEWELAVDRFTQYFIINKELINKNWDAYYAKIMPLLQKHFNLISGNWSVIMFLLDVHEVLSEFKAQYTYNFQKIGLLYLSCEGLATFIDPEIDIWENARAYTDRYSPYMSAEVKESFDRFYGNMIPKSIEMRDKAKEFMIAPTHLDRIVLPSTYPLFVQSASGCKLTDIDGNVYVDLSCGYGPHILGYNHPYIQKAITDAALNGTVNALAHTLELDLAELIVDALPSADKVIFSNSGTEAVIGGVRIARGYKRKYKIAKFEGHYHGFSDQGLVGSWFRFRGTLNDPEPYAPLGVHPELVNSTLLLQYGMKQSLERIWQAKDELAGVLIEPMPSSLAASDIPFLQNLRDLCSELDIPLIFDEVVSGFRVAYEGVQGLTGVEPDITCLGKIIGGGLPCGAVAGKARFIDVAKTSEDPFIDVEDRVFLGGTMSGNYLTCAAGKAMLTYLKEHPAVYDDLNTKTVFIKNRFTKTCENYGIPFKMVANHSFFAMTFSSHKSKYVREKAFNSNVKANVALAYYMRKYGVYMPELHVMFLSDAHKEDDLNVVCESYDKSLEEMIKDKFFDA